MGEGGKGAYAIIEDVDCKLVHAERVEERLDRDRKAVERVLVLALCWHLRKAERRQVRRQDAEFRREERDEPAELEGRGWEAVQQK